jgi:malate dehydrogenase
MDELSDQIMKHNQTAKVLIITNPVDILTWYMKRKWPEMNVFGLGCSLDTMRFRFFIAEAVDGSVDCARGIVIGMHNETMVPLANHATVGGVPIRHILGKDVVEDVIRKTRTAGTTITQKLRNHSGNYAAVHVVTQITESIVFNRLGTFPLSVYCKGYYGYEGICLSLPSVVGQNGIKRVLEIELSREEKADLENCASVIREVIKDLQI